MEKCVHEFLYSGSSHIIRIVYDIMVLFSDLISLNISSQTWNVKNYKYAIIKNSLNLLFIDPMGNESNRLMKKLEVREYTVASVGSFQYARHCEGRFPMIETYTLHLKGRQKI